MKYDALAIMYGFTEGSGFADRGANESGKGAGRDGSKGVGRGVRRLASDNPADGGKQRCRSRGNREPDESYGGASLVSHAQFYN